MESYINKKLSDITYKSELTPIAARKFRINFRSVMLSGSKSIYPSLKQAKILSDNFSLSFGINSRI